MGRTADYSKHTCGVAACLKEIGQPWTLLIIRDAFHGIRRFEQFQHSLGLARNVLTVRLKHLTDIGILKPVLYCHRPQRYEYFLTSKGRDLSPLLAHLCVWSLGRSLTTPETTGLQQET